MAFFDPTRPAYLANPYPALAALRKQDPMFWSSDLKAWVPTRYVECSEVLHDTRRFTSDPALTDGARAEAITAHRSSVPLGDVPHLGTTSGEEHRALRHLVNPVFSPTAARNAEASIAATVDTFVEALPEGQPFDFMTAFANPLPKLVMAAVIGCPEGDQERLNDALRTIEVTRSNARPAPGHVAAAKAARGTAAAVLEPYRNGGLAPTTVLGALMPASGDGLAVDEVTSMAAQIATVGADPTTGALANSIAALAEHPMAAEALRRDPAKMHLAVHELLRYDSPSHIVPRFVVVDTELGGKRVHRGDTIFAMVGAANRDPAMFLAPDDLDIERDARRQLSFGQGEHICLGAALALVILEVALNRLLKRFTSIELVAPPRFGAAIQLRVPDSLILRCA